MSCSHNDEHNPDPLWDNSARRPLERLVRKLLDYPQVTPCGGGYSLLRMHLLFRMHLLLLTRALLYPQRPAVLMLHTYDWHETKLPKVTETNCHLVPAIPDLLGRFPLPIQDP